MSRPTWPRHLEHGVAIYKPKPGAKRQQYRVVWNSPDGDRKMLWRTDVGDAMAAAKEVVHQLSAVEAGQPRQQHATVEEMIAAYLAHGRDNLEWSLSHAEQTEGLMRRHITPHIGDRSCASLTVNDMHALITRVRESGVAPRNLAVTLRGMASYGRRYGWLPHDPMDGVTIPRNGSRQQGQSTNYVDPSKRPDTASVERLAEKVAEVTGEWWRGLEVRLAAYTGLRWGEEHELRVGDIDWDTGTIHVARQVLHANGGKRHIHLPKERKMRDTFVPGFLRADLERRVAELASTPEPFGRYCTPRSCREAVHPGVGPLLFPARGMTWAHPSNFAKRVFRPACEAADWPKTPDGEWRWSWHSLRHHFCTWCLATPPDGLGLEVADVSMFAGHATPAFTWTAYVSTRKGAVQRAVAATSLDAAAVQEDALDDAGDDLDVDTVGSLDREG